MTAPHVHVNETRWSSTSLSSSPQYLSSRMKGLEGGAERNARHQCISRAHIVAITRTTITINATRHPTLNVRSVPARPSKPSFDRMTAGRARVCLVADLCLALRAADQGHRLSRPLISLRRPA